MAKFLGIRFKNFLSVGNSFVKFNLGTADITLIVGKNGRGKSQIVDALSFVLFKRPIRSIKLDQLVNSVNKKELVVELALQSKGDNYIVRRGLKPNIFEIFKNGELIPQTAGLDEYQRMLEEEILNLSYKTFKQVDVITKTSYTPFLDLSAADRRAVVEDLLDLHVYGVISDIAKSDVKDLKQDISTLDKEIGKLKIEIQGQYNLIERQKENQNDKIALIEEAIQTQKEKIAEWDKYEKDNKEAAEHLKQRLAALPISAEKVGTAIRDLNTSISSLESSIRQNQSQIQRMERLDCCPTCKQDVQHSHKQSIIETLNEEIENNQKEVDKLKGRLAKLEPIDKEHVQINQHQFKCEQELKQILNHRGSCEQQIQNLERKIVELSAENSVVTGDDQEKLNKLNAELKELIESFDSKNKRLDVLSRAIKLCSDTGLKSLVISKYIPKINDRLNFYLNKMDMFVEFTLDEQFNETIKARHRDKYSYHSFSEGQKARINIALLFTWRDIAMIRNSTMSNLLLLDETFDGSMDYEGTSEISALLNSITELGTTVYLISHNEAYRETFDKVIEVSLDGNFSEYKELK